MIGYLLAQELANCLLADRLGCTLLKRVEVDAGDPAFAHPNRPIGRCIYKPKPCGRRRHIPITQGADGHAMHGEGR